jgi:hypothetical protein
LIVRFGASRPFADPDKAARKLIEIANDVEAVQDRRASTLAHSGRRILSPWARH